jgi:xanthine dehydrogenase molybdopterin-binding subunit B
MKIVLNKCFGGFGISDKAFEKYLEYKGIDYVKTEDKRILGGANYYDTKEKKLTYYNIERDDPILVKVVEELGDKANGRFSDLEVVEIPDDIEWDIEEYDGKEWVAEKHRTW